MQPENHLLNAFRASVEPWRARWELWNRPADPPASAEMARCGAGRPAWVYQFADVMAEEKKA